MIATRPKVLVTGATGKTGAPLVAELFKRDWPVRAMVSREDARSEHFINFNLTPFYPAYDIRGYERRLELPIPPKAIYCMENDRWRKHRAAQMTLHEVATSQPAKVVEEGSRDDVLRLAQAG